MDKPDCAVCGLPYHRHDIGSHVLCPIIATYRPKPPEAADEITRLKGEVGDLRAERDLLQEIIDSRPAINGALPDSYTLWSLGIMSGEAYRARSSGKAGSE